MKIIELKSLPLPVWVVETDGGKLHPFTHESMLYQEATLLGKLTDLTEQQFGDLVHSLPAIFYNRRVFKDYKRDHKFPCDTYLLDRAEKSFISAIEAEGYVTELTECDNEWCENGYIDEGWGEYSRCIKCLDIENMEEKVIDLNRCYVFISDIEAEYKRNVDAYAKEKFRK